jgi:hypothetical protein
MLLIQPVSPHTFLLLLFHLFLLIAFYCTSSYPIAAHQSCYSSVHSIAFHSILLLLIQYCYSSVHPIALLPIQLLLILSCYSSVHSIALHFILLLLILLLLIQSCYSSVHSTLFHSILLLLAPSCYSSVHPIALYTTSYCSASHHFAPIIHLFSLHKIARQSIHQTSSNQFHPSATLPIFQSNLSILSFALHSILVR